MAEGQRRRHRPLGGGRRTAPAPGRPPGGRPQTADRQQRGSDAERRRDGERRERSDHADRMPTLDPAPVDRLGAAGDERRSDEAADERVAGARRQPQSPCRDVPDDRREQARGDHLDPGVPADGHDAADRVGHRGPDDERAEQIEDRRQQRGLQRPGGARRHERRDRVRGVVDPVGEREQDRERHGETESGVHGTQPAGRSARVMVHAPVRTGVRRARVADLRARASRTRLDTGRIVLIRLCSSRIESSRWAFIAGLPSAGCGTLEGSQAGIHVPSVTSGELPRGLTGADP